MSSVAAKQEGMESEHWNHPDALSEQALQMESETDNATRESSISMYLGGDSTGDEEFNLERSKKKKKKKDRKKKKKKKKKKKASPMKQAPNALTFFQDENAELIAQRKELESLGDEEITSVGVGLTDYLINKATESPAIQPPSSSSLSSRRLSSKAIASSPATGRHPQISSSISLTSSNRTNSTIDTALSTPLVGDQRSLMEWDRGNQDIRSEDLQQKRTPGRHKFGSKTVIATRQPSSARVLEPAPGPSSSFRDQKNELIASFHQQQGFRDEKLSIVCMLIEETQTSASNEERRNANQQHSSRSLPSKELTAPSPPYQHTNRANSLRSSRFSSSRSKTRSSVRSSATAGNNVDPNTAWDGVDLMKAQEGGLPHPSHAPDAYRMNTPSANRPHPSTRHRAATGGMGEPAPVEAGGNRRRTIIMVVFAILLLVIGGGVAGVVFGLMAGGSDSDELATTEGPQDNTANTVTRCGLHPQDLLGNCDPFNGGSRALIPECAEASYASLPQPDSSQTSSSSCAASELARVSLALQLANSDDDHLANHLSSMFLILATIYYSTNGPSWSVESSWFLDGISPCSWFGVTCDPSGLDVTGIILEENNLVGSLPTELGLLTKLSKLLGVQLGFVPDVLLTR